MDVVENDMMQDWKSLCEGYEVWLRTKVAEAPKFRDGVKNAIIIFGLQIWGEQSQKTPDLGVKLADPHFQGYHGRDWQRARVAGGRWLVLKGSHRGRNKSWIIDDSQEVKK